MPANEETMRRQSTLHIIFAVSSVAMAAVTVWMLMADHLRPWKQVQREFHEVETAKLQANVDTKRKEELEKSKKAIDAIDADTLKLQALASSNALKISSIEAKLKKLKGTFEDLDTRKRFLKADLDSQRSFYDGMIDRDERPRAKDYLASSIAPSEQRYQQLIREFEASVKAVNRETLNRNLLAAQVVEVSETAAPGTVADVAGFQKGDVLTVAAFEAFRQEAQDTLSNVDGKGAPKTITVEVMRKQPAAVKMPDTPVTLKAVIKPATTKDDRGKMESGFETIGLAALPITPEVLKKRREDLTREADTVERTLRQKEAQYGEGSGLSGLMNRGLAALRGMPIIDLAAPPTKIQQISLPDLLINYNFKEVPRYDRCTTCHLGIDRPGYDKDAAGHDMAAVFKSHPFLADGATAIDPRGMVVPAGLYLDSNGPHPINKFGCTICHGGQGSGTSFMYASHEPNDLEEREKWEKHNDWAEMHHWDEPMLPERFMESSCVKCHHQITDVPQAKKLQAGFQRITKYGCTGCHTIGGEGSFGPDLTDNRQVGPNLRHLGSKVTKEWLVKWIKNPHAFRPDTRMPRFYEVSNNSAKEDEPKVHAEVQSMAHYLLSQSTPPQEFVEPPVAGDATKGKELFFQKGCMACHAHKEFGPESFPKSVQEYASANFGPNLSNMAEKFESKNGYKWLTNWLKSPEAYHPKTLMPNLQLSWEDSAHMAKWLLSVKPETPKRWSEPDFQVPAVDSKEVATGLNELTKLYLSKSKTYKKRTVLLSEVESTVAAMSLEEKLMYVGEKTISRLGCFGCHNIPGYESAKPIGTPLNGWGVKSPSKLDYGHVAEYLTDPKQFRLLDPKEAKKEGMTAKGEGSPETPAVGGGELASKDKAEDNKIRDYDGVDQYYFEKIEEHTRSGFLHQKLHRPRSFDYGKQKEDLKTWDDRLRMPQFAWADDNEAVEEVMTLILGLTGERIPAKYMPKYSPPKEAMARGEKLLERYNCRGCHVLEMPKFTLAAGMETAAGLPDFEANVEAAYNNRAKDYLQLYGRDNPAFAAVGGLTYDSAIKGVWIEKKPKKDEKGQVVAETPPDPKTTLIVGLKGEGEPVTIEGMPTAILEDEGPGGKPIRKMSVELWKPVIIRGFAFNIGDILVVDPDKVQKTASEGGNFAWLYATTTAEKQSTPFAPLWNRLPPPLLREGKKVQTPWLTGFFNDPYVIRPVANLRMPKFHFGTTAPDAAEMSSAMGGKSREEAQVEMSQLANYFAARDGAEFPYQVVPEREQAYLASQEKEHKDYLGAGWSLVTKGACVQCHAVGTYKPPLGGAVLNGPALNQVHSRFRDRYLFEWLGRPNRLIPYTGMPQNIEPHGSPAPGAFKSLEGKPAEQVRSIRDTLLNFSSAVEQQLAGSKPAEPAKEAAPATPKAGGGGPG